MGIGIFYNISVEDGNPDGIKVIENSNKTLKALLFPRHRLQEFRTREEAKKAGVYILYNSLDHNEQPHVYIGQTGYGINSRLTRHNKEKDFWNQALIFVEKGDSNSLNSTHTKIIESIMIKTAQASGFFVMENKEDSRLPKTSKADVATALIWADEVVAITQLIGLAFFADKDSYLIDTNKRSTKKQPSKNTGHLQKNTRKLPSLPDSNMKAGKFVRKAMENLMSIDWFTDAQLDFLSLTENTKNLTRRNLPLLFELKQGQERDELEQTVKDRYWDQVFTFSGRFFLLFSQWYPDGNKRHPWKSEFIDFYKSLNG